MRADRARAERRAWLRRRLTGFVSAFLSLAVMAGAPAVPVPVGIEAAYASGDYAGAVAAALADGGAPALSLGARASLAAAMLEADPAARDGAVDTALRLATAALAQDPDAIEAHLQAAIALGLTGRREGPVEAHLRGLARPARVHIDAALAADPANPWAWAALGAWHLEIVAGGGAGPARLLYGARRNDGIAAFDRAIGLAPDNLVMRYERALCFAAFDPADLEPRIRADLAVIAGLGPSNALERTLQVRAAQLAAALDAGRTAPGALPQTLAALRGGYEAPSSERLLRARLDR